MHVKLIWTKCLRNRMRQFSEVMAYESLQHKSIVIGTIKLCSVVNKTKVGKTHYLQGKKRKALVTKLKHCWLSVCAQ
jgi:hypothetical protein